MPSTSRQKYAHYSEYWEGLSALGLNFEFRVALLVEPALDFLMFFPDDFMNRSCHVIHIFSALIFSMNMGVGTLPVKASSPVLQSTAIQIQDPFEQGLNAYRSGQFSDAIEYWQRALELYDSPQQQARTLGNLAIAYYETGQYLSALEANQAARDLFAEMGQTGAVGQVQSNLGNVYEALGDYDSAIAAYEESLAIARATQNRIAEGVSLGNLGYLYSVQGDPSAALEKHQESLAIARETGDYEGESHRLLNIGIAYHSLEEIALAAESYQLSLEVARELGYLSLEARALGNLGMAAADAGKHDEAIAYYEQSLAVSETLHNPELTARTLNNFGHTLMEAGQLEQAEARLRTAITNLDSLRSGLGDAYNVSVFDTQIYTYNLLTQVLVKQNQPEEALKVAEAGRARAFTELLRNRLDVSSEVASAEFVTSSSLSISDIQAIAQQTNATLVEYTLVPDAAFRVHGKQNGPTAEIYIWVVQPDGTIEFRQKKVDAQGMQLKDLVTQSRSDIGVRGRGLSVIQDDEDESPKGPDKLQVLHQLLIEPIQDLLPQTPEDKVVLIPQGDLFLVPFPALLDEAGDRLIQHHTLLTAPSISVLDLTHQRRTHLRGAQTATAESADWLIVGNPEMPEVWNPQLQTMEQLPTLQGAEQEALEVATLFNTEALIGKAASESRIKDRIETAQVVHLATHGLLEYGSAASSGIQDIPGAIALTPAVDEDGLLTSAEILNELTLQADLVVLSACDTGRGDITGDGVLGLSRSLIAAGAPSVVVSLWSVPDAPTADLMVKFYAELKQGKDKAQALRQAMLATMQAYPDPQNWAAFTLIGEAQ